MSPVLSGLTEVLFVGAGGFLGASLRYIVSGLVQRLDPMGTFPYGTMSVNVVGCLVIGVLGGLADSRHALGPNARLFVILGVLGGFTTFSTFAFESLALLRDGESLRAGANVFGSVVACLVSVWLGYSIGAR
jgi:fluoride exporter